MVQVEAVQASVVPGVIPGVPEVLGETEVSEAQEFLEVPGVPVTALEGRAALARTRTNSHDLTCLLNVNVLEMLCVY